MPVNPHSASKVVRKGPVCRGRLKRPWSGPSALGSCYCMKTWDFAPGWYKDALSALDMLL